MLDEKLVQYCSPTLAGLKAGSLFSCAYAGAEDRLEFRTANRQLAQKGLRLIPLRIRGGRALTYLYRPSELQKALNVPAACALLEELGYGGLTSEECLICLRRKLQAGGDFPHEIGLFLGYPAEDVRGFMADTAACTCTGCWKVYGDAAEAQRLFDLYACCTSCYQNQLKSGTSLSRLAVAV